MISYIKGELTEVFEDTVVVETNGIGYNIRVPGSVLDRLPSVGSSVRIYTYLYVKEDAMNLFGFLNRDDLSVFKLLLNVSGIGPKGALAILSTIGPDDLRFAVLSEDVKTISSGAGFSVSSDGKALNNAAEGQVVQVRTNTGQTVSGIARPGGIVEISH